MPSLRTQLIAEFNETFGINGQDGKTYPAMDAQNVKQFLIQAIERTVEAMKLEKKECKCKNKVEKMDDCFMHNVVIGYNNAVERQITAKKLILGTEGE